MDPTPQQILQIDPLVPTSPDSHQKKTSVGWIIIWLLGFTPWGCYLIFRRTSWPLTVKMIVSTVSMIVFIILCVESELIGTQIANFSVGPGLGTTNQSNQNVKDLQNLLRNNGI